MASIKTGTGCTIAIGTVLATTGGTQAEYEADTYVAAGDVESIGEFGDTRNKVTFASLDDGRTRKARGTADAGDSVIVYAHKTADTGQDNIAAAFAATSQATDEFNFRVRLNDQISTSPTTFYFRAKIFSHKLLEITNDGIVRKSVELGINTAVLEVAAA